MTDTPQFKTYAWAGGCEGMLCFGCFTGPVVVMALPLFEEAGRTRTFFVAIGRALARRGISSVIPDLPGQGESLMTNGAVRLAALRQAHADLVKDIGEECCFGLAARSGVLFDTKSNLKGSWRLSPQDGESLSRELNRMRRIVALGRHTNLDHNLVETAGYALSTTFLNELANATPVQLGKVRVARLLDDFRPADVYLAGTAIWRQSEPVVDLNLVEAIVDDVLYWIEMCGS